MALWIWLGLLSHLGWAFGNIVDKYIIKNHLPNIWVYFVWAGLADLAVITLLPFINFTWPTTEVIVWMFLMVVVNIIGSLFYYKAVSVEEISRINIWWALIPVYVLIIGWLALGEGLTIQQFMAFAVLLLGALVASFHIKAGRQVLRFSRGLGFMLVSCFFYAIGIVITRFAVQQAPFTDVLVLTALFWIMFSGLALLYRPLRRDFIMSAKQLPIKIILAIIISIAVGLYAALFSHWALSLGPAALVFALEGSQSLMVFGLTLLIAFWRPQALAEETDKKNLAIKSLALIIVIFGIILLNNAV